MVDNSLTKLTYNRRTFYYKVRIENDGIFNSNYTDFYNTNDKIKLVRRYIFFGPLDAEFDNELAFTLDFNIESCEWSKTQIQGFLNNKWDELKRCEEIGRGEII